MHEELKDSREETSCAALESRDENAIFLSGSHVAYPTTGPDLCSID